MTRTITLTVADDSLGQCCTEKQIRHILMDALAEFVSHRRTPTAEAYVNKRYPDTPNYAWLNRSAKIGEVIARCEIAECLHNAEIEVK